MLVKANSFVPFILHRGEKYDCSKQKQLILYALCPFSMLVPTSSLSLCNFIGVHIMHNYIPDLLFSLGEYGLPVPLHPNLATMDVARHLTIL